MNRKTKNQSSTKNENVSETDLKVAVKDKNLDEDLKSDTNPEKVNIKNSNAVEVLKLDLADKIVWIIAGVATLIILLTVVLVFNWPKDDKAKCIESQPYLFGNTGNCDTSSTSITSSSDSSSYSQTSSYSSYDPYPSSGQSKSNYPRAKSSFATQYSKYTTPNGTNKFWAVYLDQSKNGDQFVDKELVDQPRINYAWSDFKGIKSENFAAYYSTNFEFEKDTLQEINVSVSRSKVKVYIDEFLVIDSEDSSKSIEYFFTAGKHTIEVEYENNWHTVEFAMNINDVIPKYTQKVAGNIIKSDLQDFDIYYVGAYESGDRLLETKVNILNSSKPIVLVLSSYSSINWNLMGDGLTQVKYVLISSYKPGSQVLNPTQDMKIFNTPDIKYEYVLLPDCKVYPGSSGVNCENKGAIELNKSFKTNFGKSIGSFAGAYSPKILDIGTKKLISADWENYEKEAQKILQNPPQYNNSNCTKTPTGDLLCP